MRKIQDHVFWLFGSILHQTKEVKRKLVAKAQTRTKRQPQLFAKRILMRWASVEVNAGHADVEYEKAEGGGQNVLFLF